MLANASSIPLYSIRKCCRCPSLCLCLSIQEQRSPNDPRSPPDNANYAISIEVLGTLYAPLHVHAPALLGGPAGLITDQQGFTWLAATW